MRKSEKYIDIIVPNIPPMLVYKIVSVNDIPIAYTAIGKVAANFQEEKKIMVNAFTSHQK